MRPIAQGRPSPLQQLVVDNSLVVVTALAAIVAVVATAMAWRAGRRARRAADLVAQLLDPPVLEPVVTEPAPAPALATAPAPVPEAGPVESPEPRPTIVAPSFAAREERRGAPSGTSDGNDPAPTRIPVLDLDRLRSWLTLGDVN